VCLLPEPVSAEFEQRFDRSVRPVLAAADGPPFACLSTEYAPNTFPALPVRTGVHAFVWLARFAGPAALADHCGRTRDALATLPGEVQRLRLAPTGRSWLR
jgi:hypothetical protein